MLSVRRVSSEINQAPVADVHPPPLQSNCRACNVLAVGPLHNRLCPYIGRRQRNQRRTSMSMIEVYPEVVLLHTLPTVEDFLIVYLPLRCSCISGEDSTYSVQLN